MPVGVVVGAIPVYCLKYEMPKPQRVHELYVGYDKVYPLGGRRDSRDYAKGSPPSGQNTTGRDDPQGQDHALQGSKGWRAERSHCIKHTNTSTKEK